MYVFYWRVSKFILCSLFKNKFHGRYFFLRGLIGNWIGETIETLLFIPAAFYYLPQITIIKLIFFYISFKAVYALFMMPVAKGLVVLLKSKEINSCLT